jgi:hypothetical protein
MVKRWSIRKRNGEWRIYQGDSWHDTEPDFLTAFDSAERYAHCDWIFNYGGTLNRGGLGKG